MRKFSLALICLLASANCLADLYVSPSGSDSSSGSPSAPFRTISQAASVASAGMTVHVAPGTYYENITTSNSGTSSAHIRFVSDTKWGAKIIGSGTEGMWTNNGSYVEIIGFDVSGSGRLGIVNYGSYTLISGNLVHDLTVSGGCTSNGGAGIDDANYSATDDDIIGNIVHDIGVPGACNEVQGIYHSNLRGHIINNVVYRVSAWGIQLWHAANNVTIENNTLVANGSSNMGGGMMLGDGDAPGGIVLDNTVVANNILYNNPDFAIREYCYSGSSCIGSNVLITNNLIYGGGGNSLLTGSASGTISNDPLFVNSASDFHLQASSPAINNAAAAYAPSTDLDGNARPQGAGYDIGAYEFVVAASPSPSPSVSPSPIAASLKLSSTQVAPGGNITVTFSGAGASINEYLALYLASDPDTAWAYNENWMYPNGTQTAPAAPISSGTVTFIAPQQAGTYNIRFFESDNFSAAGNLLAVSPIITVAAMPSPAPSPSPSPSYVLQISSPQANASVSGTVQIVGSAVGFVNVEVSSSSGALLSRVTPSASGAFSASVDTTMLSNGLQTLTINAWDSPAGQSFSHTAQVKLALNVSNVDTVVPVTSITSPVNGGTVSASSTVTIRASASDNVGVKSVSFYVNGNLKCATSTAPYSCNWNVPRGRGKTYQLQTKASDAAGNVGSSAVVSVISK